LGVHGSGEHELTSRFAVANVDDETIKKVGPRLRRFNEIMGIS
jgi:hypothetical protein